MPLASIPAIDVNQCSGWTEQDINLYNSLPFFFAKLQVERRNRFLTWGKLVGSRPWTPNQGDTMKGIRTEMAPYMRQFAFPNEICAAPKKDVYDLREVTTTATVKRQKFESPVLNFCPSFRDFLNHVNDNSKNIMEQMERFEEVFLRGEIFYQSPHVWLPNKANGELVVAPMGPGNAANTAANSKNIGWLQAQLPLIGQPGNLSLATLSTLATVMEVDLDIPPFSGNSMPRDDKGFSDKFVIVGGSEAYNQFTFDPYVAANKNCQFDIVNDSFHGSLFGRMTYKFERFPLRIAADGTFPVPQIRQGNPAAYNYGENEINPLYANAPYEVAWGVGAEGYEKINVGPPPKEFAGGSAPLGFGKMVWNGEVFMNKNLIIPCTDDNNVVQYDTNSYGEYLRFQAMATYGIIGKQRRNIVPIIFKRLRGVENEAVA